MMPATPTAISRPDIEVRLSEGSDESETSDAKKCWVMESLV